ncbi:WD40/YVTN/BNR-like repeat-containing protein [Aquimarina megaterium]|uniref:WD40/YVTN/BNR-like repeat-containing protein n=1 Tax=Aquimarina megaterium TaxID=1443666 RepID=UPI0009437532|nr:oxidoreductase [Aquimarina megaterium]
MKLIYALLFVLTFVFCTTEEKVVTHHFSKVEIETILKDSISIRALAIYNDTLIGFGYNKGYGFINLATKKKTIIEFSETDTIEKKKNWIAEQRAVGFTDKSFFSLGVSSPARLRKIDRESKEEKIVYTEMHEKAFYDAIAFWNVNEGIAMGDPTDMCLSILITRDGGDTWKKISCEDLPKTFVGEAAFAASNGNIAIIGDKTWIATGGMKSRVFFSPDKGKTWEVYDTPIIQGKETTGAYSIDFYDENNGVVYGGDYTAPEGNEANKAITKDGGKTWELVSDGSGAGYKSCIRYIPNGGGKEMVAVGFTGISISNDLGGSWKELSKEGFYTVRFINDSVAIAAGKGRIAKLVFK